MAGVRPAKGRHLRTRTILATAGTLSLLAAPAAARASTQPPPRPAVAYAAHYSSAISCATWKGTIGWGTHPLGDHYLDVDGTLKSTCRTGWAKLHLHYDTVSNPKDITVGTAENGGTAGTHFSTTDTLFAYKHIYVELCSQNRGHYTCGNRKGPQ